MKPSRLDKFIEIITPTQSRNAANDPIESDVTHARVWAEKRDKRGREFFGEAGKVGEAECIWIMRWIDGVTKQMKILYDGTYYDILHIGELGRREGLEITTKTQDTANYGS